jgi:hypothetical protein
LTNDGGLECVVREVGVDGTLRATTPDGTGELMLKVHPKSNRLAVVWVSFASCVYVNSPLYRDRQQVWEYLLGQLHYELDEAIEEAAEVQNRIKTIEKKFKTLNEKQWESIKEQLREQARTPSR